MLKMIKWDEQDKIYIVVAQVKVSLYINRMTEIPDLRDNKSESGIREYWSPIRYFDNWIDNYRKDGFGEYTYIVPRPSRKPRKEKKPTKKELIQERMRNFKKTLIKRKPQFRDDTRCFVCQESGPTHKVTRHSDEFRLCDVCAKFWRDDQ